MSRLKKLDVVQMMERYDHDPVTALTEALRIVLDEPEGEWTAMVKTAGFSCAQRIRLQGHDPAAMDELLTYLNELRTTPSRA